MKKKTLLIGGFLALVVLVGFGYYFGGNNLQGRFSAFDPLSGSEEVLNTVDTGDRVFVDGGMYIDGDVSSISSGKSTTLYIDNGDDETSDVRLPLDSLLCVDFDLSGDCDTVNDAVLVVSNIQPGTSEDIYTAAPINDVGSYLSDNYPVFYSIPDFVDVLGLVVVDAVTRIDVGGNVTFLVDNGGGDVPLFNVKENTILCFDKNVEMTSVDKQNDGDCDASTDVIVELYEMKELSTTTKLSGVVVNAPVKRIAADLAVYIYQPDSE